MNSNDDATAEAIFQGLRASGRSDLLLEIATFVVLEARCGELHAKLLDEPTDRQLEALYGAYSHLWELCRGMVDHD